MRCCLCRKLTSADEQTKVLMASCSNQCPKEVTALTWLQPGLRPTASPHCVCACVCVCVHMHQEFPCSQSGVCVQCDDSCREQQRKLIQVGRRHLAQVR